MYDGDESRNHILLSSFSEYSACSRMYVDILALVPVNRRDLSFQLGNDDRNSPCKRARHTGYVLFGAQQKRAQGVLVMRVRGLPKGFGCGSFIESASSTSCRDMFPVQLANGLAPTWYVVGDGLEALLTCKRVTVLRCVRI